MNNGNGDRREHLPQSRPIPDLPFPVSSWEAEQSRLAATMIMDRVGEKKATKIKEPTYQDCPPLPTWARPDPRSSANAGAWLDQFKQYSQAISPMTPELFHESAGLWLASVAIARRLKISMHFGDVYSNVYILWLAETTLYRKTTCLQCTRTIARDAFPHLLAPQDMTPEGFLSDLAGREPANLDSMSEQDRDLWNRERDFCGQRGLLLDEMSGLLAAAGRDYNAGLLEALLRFYDCDPMYTRSTRGQGRTVIHNSYLSLISASTPAAIAVHMTSPRLWANGLWPRFGLLTPEADKPKWQTPREVEIPPDLIPALETVYSRLPFSSWPEIPRAKCVSISAEAYRKWELYNKAVGYDLLTDDLDTLLWGTYGRLPTQALKIAMILASLDWRDTETPVIEMPQMARAIMVAEGWRSSAHRAVSLVTTNEFNRMQQRILRQVGQHGSEGATLREIYRGMQDKTPAEIQEALDQMVRIGLLEKVVVKPGSKGGRPAERYRIANG